VREQLIAYLKGEHAEALPRARAEVSVPEAGGSRQPAGEPTAGDALPA
jgi:hypothetical protein